MAIYYDPIDFQRDNFEVIPRNEWRIMGIYQAKKPIKIPRWCRPNCEAFQMDFDKKPICQFGCKEYIFEQHIIDTDEKVYNLLFAVDTTDVHQGFATLIGEKYLRSFLGDKKVDRMLQDYNELMKPPETNLEDYIEEDD